MLYAGDEVYDDDVTSPLVRPVRQPASSEDIVNSMKLLFGTFNAQEIMNVAIRHRREAEPGREYRDVLLYFENHLSRWFSDTDLRTLASSVINLDSAVHSVTL